MTKSELIKAIATKQPHLNIKDVEQIEIRGFASFSLRYRPPRMSRNPSTGETISLTSRYAPHFKPGQELRERVQKNND